MLQYKRKVDKCFSPQLDALGFIVTAFSSVISRLQKGLPHKLPDQLTSSFAGFYIWGHLRMKSPTENIQVTPAILVFL